MSRTRIRRLFAGAERSLDLRIGEIIELERLCHGGIGEIVQRIIAQTYQASDIRETIRLGLMGGGMPDGEATKLVMASVDGYPLAHSLQLAADILQSVVYGLPPEEEPAEGKAAAEGTGSTASPPGT